MSTVVRKGIIELELRAVKARLESPQIDAAARAYKEVEKAQTETAKATQEVAKETVQATKATQEFGVKSLAAFREGGEGALRMARGIALLSASGSDDLQKLIRQVALAQGAFDIFAGGFKAFTNISAVLGGPFTLAIAGVTTALGAGAIAWNRWKSEAEAAAKSAAESVKANIEQSRQALEAFRRDMERSERRIGATVSDRLEQERRQTMRRHLEEEQMRTESGILMEGSVKSEIAAAIRRQTPTRTDEAEQMRLLRHQASEQPMAFSWQLRRETELNDVLRKRLEVEKNFLRTDAAQAEAQTRGFQAALTQGPIGFGQLGAPIFAQVAAGAETQLQNFVRSMQDSLDVIESEFSAAAERIRKMGEVIRDIDAANTK